MKLGSPYTVTSGLLPYSRRQIARASLIESYREQASGVQWIELVCRCARSLVHCRPEGEMVRALTYNWHQHQCTYSAQQDSMRQATPAAPLHPLLLHLPQSHTPSVDGHPSRESHPLLHPRGCTSDCVYARKATARRQPSAPHLCHLDGRALGADEADVVGLGGLMQRNVLPCTCGRSESANDCMLASKHTSGGTAGPCILQTARAAGAAMQKEQPTVDT